MKINKDLVIILTLVIFGMFFPFLGSIVINFNVDITNVLDIIKIAGTFGWFLFIFAFELGFVFLYFQVTSKMANKKLNELENK
jgi:hypothetical protein